MLDAHWPGSSSSILVIQERNCKGCHLLDIDSFGPSYLHLDILVAVVIGFVFIWNKRHIEFTITGLFPIDSLKDHMHAYLLNSCSEAGVLNEDGLK